jgi:hypothetical protein
MKNENADRINTLPAQLYAAPHKILPVRLYRIAAGSCRGKPRSSFASGRGGFSSDGTMAALPMHTPADHGGLWRPEQHLIGGRRGMIQPFDHA